jgi:hypothetical protein
MSDWRIMKRRRFLKATGASLSIPLLSSCLDGSEPPSEQVQYGPGGSDPLAKGGTHKPVARSEADFTVDSGSRFVESLDDAGTGDVVFVDPSTRIDLTDRETVTIPGGVTLASGPEGGDASVGEIATDGTPRPLLRTGGDGVRISGLRIRGQKKEGLFDPGEDVYQHDSVGIRSDHESTVIDNCEVSNFTHSGILCAGSNEHVYRCNIHDNAMAGLGYGISVLSSSALVEHNYFNYNRHSVTASGQEADEYVYRFNRHGPKTVRSALDVHCPGGNRFAIHHNRFEFTHNVNDTPTSAVFVCGTPRNDCEVSHNFFAHPDPPGDESENGDAIWQKGTDGWENLRYWANRYGWTGPTNSP